MVSAGTERRPGTQEEMAEGPAQLAEAPSDHTQSSECPVIESQGRVSAHEACRTHGEDKCPAGRGSEAELQEERLMLEETRLKPGVEALEERRPRPKVSIVRSSHGPKRKPVKAEAELPQGLLLQKEEQEGSQNEHSPCAKQHKKAKKRKSMGAPVHPAVASTMPAASETLGLERKTQHLRPLYQYINYSNPELNQAREADREVKAELQPESELILVPEEGCVEQLPALLPVAEYGFPNKMPEEEEPGKGGGFPIAGFEA